MKRVWLWGAGDFVDQVIKCVQSGVQLCGIFDNAKHLTGSKKSGLEIFFPEKNIVLEDDLIVITILRYEELLHEVGGKLGIKKSQVVPFFDINFNKETVSGFLDGYRWECAQNIVFLKKQVKDLTLQLNNIGYEMADKIRNQEIVFPQIIPGEKALEQIIYQNKSLCRYGDGEFEIILGRTRPFFQRPDKELGRRLKQILTNSEERILTCIADNYGCLDKYTDNAANAIRGYLTSDIREEQMSLIDLKKEYYDAYISRPYILFKDKSQAEKKFSLWRRVWDNRDVIMVEGELTRSGYKNDLFHNTKSFQRILCPAEQAWDYYKEIYDFIIQNISTDKLILIALGPTATVLAFDLARLGYQAIDMGHLDNEYEWYLRGAKDIINISYKYVHEYSAGKSADEIDDVEYTKQIIKKIGC